MRDLLRAGAFRRFWLAGLLFQLATWSLHVAVLVITFELTDSPFATGLIPVFSALPGVVLGPVAGVLVDRYDRRRVMIVSTGAIMAVLGAATAILAGPLDGDPRPWLVFAVILLQAVAMTTFSPAENATLPRLVPADRLATANALNALNDGMGRIVGPAIGAVVVAAAGFGAILVVAIGLYGLAAVVLIGVRADTRPDRTATAAIAMDREPFGAMRRMLSEVGAGFGVVRTSRALALVVLAFALFRLADVPLSAVVSAFVLGDLGAGADDFGTMMTLRGVSGLLGGLLVAALSHRVDARRLLIGGLVLHGLGILTWGLLDSFRVGLFTLIVVGPAAAAIQTGLFTLLQRATADATRGRVFALVGTTDGLVIMAASASGGALGEVTSARTVVILSGALYALPVLLASRLPGRGGRGGAPPPRAGSESLAT